MKYLRLEDKDGKDTEAVYVQFLKDTFPTPARVLFVDDSTGGIILTEAEAFMEGTDLMFRRPPTDAFGGSIHNTYTSNKTEIDEKEFLTAVGAI